MSSVPEFMELAHFRPATTRDEARRLFAASVSMVEVELFSYCNRVCWFCPNSSIDRRSQREFMAPAIYHGILDRLAEIDYAGSISYSRYNEPLADRSILDRIAEARAAVPRATLHTNTNGDYLTRDYLDALYEAGLRSMNVQIYLGNDERYDHARMRAKLAKVASTLRLDAEVVRDSQDEWLEHRALYQDMQLRVYARNFERNGSNRGGTVPVRMHYRRLSPCYSPVNHVYVDYTGKMMPCCNLRSDVETHQDAVVGDLSSGDDLFSVYGGAALASWRAALVGFGAKSGHCASCAFAAIADTPEARLAHAGPQSLAAAALHTTVQPVHDAA